MKIVLDNQLYNIDGEKVCQHMHALYLQYSNQEGATLADGTKIDFSKKSLLWLGLKQVVAKFIMPILRDMFRTHNLVIPEHKKHSDAIDYFMLCLFLFLGKRQEDVQFFLTSEDSDGNGKNITSCTTTRPEPKRIPENTGETRELYT